MSSSYALLGYVFDYDETESATDIRIDAASMHLAPVFGGELALRQARDTRSGLLAWVPTDEQIRWKRFVRTPEGAVGWLHVPAPSLDRDEVSLANAVLDGQVPANALGAPFAVMRWSPGKFDIANDVFGLSRLYEYKFPGGRVWTTRMGLAHVFMGEAPRAPSRLAWGGMATLGWAAGGALQLGDGRQLDGHERISVSVASGTPRFETDKGFFQWLGEARASGRASFGDMAESMLGVVASSREWPEGPVADLSGGKDSRVIAALGLRSGTIRAVRTVDTDKGEVAVARELIARATIPVEHRVVPRRPSGRSAQGMDSVMARLVGQHRAFEGRYLAPSGFRLSDFRGFRGARHARLSGLGGEAAAGGNLASGTWKDRLRGAPIDVATDRLVAKVNVNFAASESARSAVSEFAATFARDATAADLPDASAAVDLFYLRDQMPYWSVTFAMHNSVCPFFAPELVATAARSLGSPFDFGELQSGLVRALMPEWADVPYYKSSDISRRTVPPLWYSDDWPALDSYVRQAADALASYSPDGLVKILDAVTDGAGEKFHEVVIQRFLWELSFQEYADTVRESANECRRALQNLAAKQSGAATAAE